MRREKRLIELDDGQLDEVHAGAHIPRLPEFAASANAGEPEQPSHLDLHVFDLLYGREFL